MGLLKHLLLWPYTGPRFLIDFSLGQIDGVVREELTDDTVVKAELMELQLRLELGDIDDAQYVAEEALLMQRLRDIRTWRERLGMGVSGGLVRVQSSEEDSEAEGEEPADEPKAPQVADPKGAEIDFNLDWE
ncbi:MAG: gas vesicle protein GvpG [Longimicrobiales bacterium]